MHEVFNSTLCSKRILLSDRVPASWSQVWVPSPAGAAEQVFSPGSAFYANSKHWFTTSFLGGRCRKALLGVCLLCWLWLRQPLHSRVIAVARIICRNCRPAMFSVPCCCLYPPRLHLLSVLSCVDLALHSQNARVCGCFWVCVCVCKHLE